MVAIDISRQYMMSIEEALNLEFLAGMTVPHIYIFPYIECGTYMPVRETKDMDIYTCMFILQFNCHIDTKTLILVTLFVGLFPPETFLLTSLRPDSIKSISLRDLSNVCQP